MTEASGLAPPKACPFPDHFLGSAGSDPVWGRVSEKKLVHVHGAPWFPGAGTAVSGLQGTGGLCFLGQSVGGPKSLLQKHNLSVKCPVVFWKSLMQLKNLKSILYLYCSNIQILAWYKDCINNIISPPVFKYTWYTCFMVWPWALGDSLLWPSGVMYRLVWQVRNWKEHWTRHCSTWLCPWFSAHRPCTWGSTTYSLWMNLCFLTCKTGRLE